jgi:serine protease
MRRTWQRLLTLVFMLTGLGEVSAGAATNLLVWSQAGDRVTADVRGWPLLDLLEAIAAQSGWQVRVEPDLEQPASVKFKNLPYGEALRLLLGDLNYALVPQTNGAARFYVFRTAQDRATQLVRAASDQSVGAEPRRVPNELIVRLKPGTDIAALAKSLGAKVVGSIPELNAYRLQFEDELATEAARKKLLAIPEVASVQDNYYVDQPFAPLSFGGQAARETRLSLDPPKQDACKVVIGMVDGRLQNLGSQLEPFIKERISVAGLSTTEVNQPNHPTAMAHSILQALQSSGRANTSVQIIAVDVFGAESSANTFNVAVGMITAANQGATIINASLGGYGNSPILSDTTRLLASKKIPVFAAVGNDASNQPFYPAADPYVIAITASERGRLAAYANVGTAATIAAPGTVVFSYNSQTYISQGTSVSTAFASGVAAGIADANCAPWSQVIPLLQKNMPVPGP